MTRTRWAAMAITTAALVALVAVAVAVRHGGWHTFTGFTLGIAAGDLIYIALAVGGVLPSQHTRGK
jgi:hypothetical protein